MPTFDGIDLVITFDSGITAVDVQDDLYSKWKDFARASDANGKSNLQFPPAFRPIAGDTLPGSLTAAPYFFLRNDLGWRLRPPEETITINLTDNLVPEDENLPMVVPTIGAFTCLILGIQPVTQGTAALKALLDQQGADLALLRKLVGGRRVVVSVDDLTVTVYEDDNVAIAAVYSVSADGRIREKIA